MAFSVPFEETNREKRLIYSTRTSVTALIDEIVFEKLLINNFDDIDSELLDLLFSMEIIIPENENEFEEVMVQNNSMLTVNSHLDLTIQPTANCQLGCHYCAQEHSKVNMADDVYDKTLERVRSKLESQKFEHLSVTWYGGEPLNALTQLKRISTEIIGLCAENKVVYDGSIITNGLSLKPGVFKELYLQHNVLNYQITLDGTAEYHDLRRILKLGGETFDIIFKNIIDIIHLPFTRKKIHNRF